MQKFLQSLLSRLPELEWKLTTLNVPLSQQTLPRHLFTFELERSAQSCIDEIREDIRVLQIQNSTQSSHYIAARIQQKINVLVQLCTWQSSQKSSQTKPMLMVDKMMTRQQLIHDLETKITQLEKQRDALQQVFENIQDQSNLQGVMTVQAELGSAERLLVEAREALAKTSG